MHYHGSNAGNGGTVHSDEIASHGASAFTKPDATTAGHYLAGWEAE
ncbi:hypothetical protein ACLB1R_24230 [Escherichia coli]